MARTDDWNTTAKTTTEVVKEHKQEMMGAFVRIDYEGGHRDWFYCADIPQHVLEEFNRHMGIELIAVIPLPAPYKAK